MEWLKDWTMTICGGAVFCAVINFLVPDERYEKIIKICTASFIMLLIVSPITNIKNCAVEYHLAETACDYSDFEKSITDQAEKHMASAAEKVIIQRLEENGISDVKISVSMDSSEDGCISIGHVTVETDDPHNADSTVIRQMLKSWFNLEDVEVR